MKTSISYFARSRWIQLFTRCADPQDKMYDTFSIAPDWAELDRLPLSRHEIFKFTKIAL